MSKHTPGPWAQWADTNIIIRLHSGKPLSEDLRICEVATNTWQDQGRYNARLIAAAPELLEALKLAQQIIGHPDDAHSKLIDAAIAKAEGK